MPAAPSTHAFDVIVIGSGIGGMATATALSRMEHKVLLLEQAQAIGGLTHSFSRHGFHWDVGLHYCGLFGDDQFAGRILNWLSGGTISFQSTGTIYDTLHFPDGFDISVGRPSDAYKMELKEHFPNNTHEIDAYFEALASAEETAYMLGVERSISEPFRSAHRWWNAKKIQRWAGRTTHEVLNELISDPKLATVLAAQWGTYGGNPKQASFAIHGMVMGHYLNGAAYPVGGAGTIAKGLVPVIEAAGGSAMTDTAVNKILIDEGKAVGVRTQTGDVFHAPIIVSALGAGETVKHLLPEDIVEQHWAKEIASFTPSICHFDLYLGLEGDIAKHGATRANHWFYADWNTFDHPWTGGDNEPFSMVFVSFPSLKDPTHNPGTMNRHTADVMLLSTWSSVAKFADGGAKAHPEEWASFKQSVETRLVRFFNDKFPDLAPMVAYHELGTPLATAYFTGHEKGGFYGVETTPRRMLSHALSARTPVPGLFLSGQDVMSPGIAGSLAGGMFCAAAIDPRVYQKLK
ncbi:NAD(P)/FAD-dependent oxidoreductase [Aestuariibacter halophilus]|uniref:NAD(P)/FAD-dependent oxidoreductase n=1 Tax=Fluctibacter halophilus TaxID=226011 RepID=A0ABS8G337_9ALTE|nr:NAD(P)/FAD-dependent oxidoreductase [Aestuariibacter halophilus]MCC2615012.1 NAD(P)/FAD-dependent oxidoreductase [Aestuariibacter halophilus]